MNYIKHYRNEDWGSTILYMEENGRASASLYWYDDDKTTMYLSELSVSPLYRNEGVGTELQILREETCKLLGGKITRLMVKKDTWMYDWYKRRGYEEFEDNVDFIWLQKELI